MENKDKYTLVSFRNNKIEHPKYLNLEEEIKVLDLITFYYYLLYPDLNYEGEHHDYYEFFICLNGRAKVETEKGAFMLSEREFLITPPNVNHTHKPDKSFLSSVSICFSATGVKDKLICFKVGKIDDRELNIVNILINEYINNYKFQDNYEQPNVQKVNLKNEYAYPQMFKCAIEMLLVLITRNFLNEANESKVNIQKEIVEEKNEIVRYIKEHYKEKIILEKVANEFNYSVGHLCRKFKQDTGDSIVNYITKYRISVATRILFENRDLSIEEVALEVGFNDVQYFNKIFKKYVGMTPGQYRSEVTKVNALHAQDIMFDIIKNI